MTIRKKQLAALFLCSLVPWVVGNGLIPLLPLYAARLGAGTAVSGYFLAISYLTLALGALSAGWVSSRFRRHKLPLIIAGALGIPVSLLLGRVSTIWGLTTLTALLWFLGGLGMALTGILAGLSAGEKERGRVFGIISLSAGLGALIGSLGVGWLVEGWGYTAMFDVLAVFLVSWPLFASLLEEKQAGAPRLENAPSPILPGSGLGRSFYFLLAASMLTAMAGFFIILIRSIVMDSLGFGALEISSTGAVGGVVSMPFPFLMGWLSDRRGRKIFLFLGNLSALVSLGVLAYSTALWHFWLVLVFQGIASGSINIGNAWVTDLVAPESVGKALAVYGSAVWMGGVIGFAAAGYALQNLGFADTFLLGGCIILAALGLLLPVRTKPLSVRAEPHLTLP